MLHKLVIFFHLQSIMFNRKNNLLLPPKTCIGKRFWVFFMIKYFQIKQANYFQLEVHESRACNAKLIPLLVSSFLCSASSCLLPSFEGREAGDGKDLRSSKAGRDIERQRRREGKKSGRKKEKKKMRREEEKERKRGVKRK